MKKLTYIDIINETLERFPEYILTHYYVDNDQKLPFSFFYGFVDYISSLIREPQNSYSEANIKKAFDLFNEMIQSKDENIVTLVVTEILPNLVQTQESKDVATRLLNQEGKKYLEEVLKSTGV